MVDNFINISTLADFLTTFSISSRESVFEIANYNYGFIYISAVLSVSVSCT